MDYSLPGPFVHGMNSLVKNTGKKKKKRIQNGLTFPSSGDCPNPGIEPRSLALQADSLPFVPPGKPHVVIHQAYSPDLPSKAVVCPIHFVSLASSLQMVNIQCLLNRMNICENAKYKIE